MRGKCELCGSAAAWRVSEILSGKRQLTMAMVRRLLTLGIPAASLVGRPEPVE